MLCWRIWDKIKRLIYLTQLKILFLMETSYLAKYLMQTFNFINNTKCVIWQQEVVRGKRGDIYTFTDLDHKPVDLLFHVLAWYTLEYNSIVLNSSYWSTSICWILDIRWSQMSQEYELVMFLHSWSSWTWTSLKQK